jgi:DNA-binding transcriptional MocR family regulator
MFCFNRDDPDYCGNAVSNASFSKIFGPGMRLGWMEVPTKVRDTIVSSGVAQSGGGFNHTASAIMSSVIQLGLMEKMLAEMRPVYQVSRG